MSHRRLRRFVLALVLALAGLPGPAPAAAPEALAAFPRSDGPLAIAVRPGSDAGGLPAAIAIGDARGAWLSEAGEPARRLLLGREVRDLVFSADGALWLGTDDGLHRRAPDDGAVGVHGPAPGAGRIVNALAATEMGVFVATGAGIHWVSARVARRLDGIVPHGVVTALCWDPTALVLHAVIAERLHAITVPEGAGGDPGEVRRIVLPPGAGVPLDLARVPGGVVILTARGLLEVRGREVRRDIPALPAGARALRVVARGARLWIAGPRGLHERVGREWRPVGGAAGRLVLTDVAVDGRDLVGVGPRGVFRFGSTDEPTSALYGAAPRRDRADPATAGPGPSGSPVAAPIATPSIEAVHRAVIRAHHLEASRGQRWRARVARRGRWPEVEIRAGYGGARGDATDYDEAFTSGALRRLNDRARDRDRDFDVQAVLRWDLGEALHHPEEVDVAKEVREWMLLRDEILDEVSQLYFERLRVGVERARLGAGDPEARLLEIRAAELGAGLDAWTDGWWSRTTRAPAPSPNPRPGPTEKRE